MNPFKRGDQVKALDWIDDVYGPGTLWEVVSVDGAQIEIEALDGNASGSRRYEDAYAFERVLNRLLPMQKFQAGDRVKALIDVEKYGIYKGASYIVSVPDNPDAGGFEIELEKLDYKWHRSGFEKDDSPVPTEPESETLILLRKILARLDDIEDAI